jgi:hypothetical protein
MPAPRSVATDLRRWAAGTHETEAAVELLLRACRGRLVDPHWPWIGRLPSGRYRLNPAAIQRCRGMYGGELRVLAVAQALLTAGPLWHPAGVLTGLNRADLTLVLAAFSHAAGSHEDVEPHADGGRNTRPLGPVVPWPKTQGRAA